MLATLGGFLALLLGLGLLLLPLLFSELSRPRDSAWGALVLLLGLVLVTSADRLTGAPMLAVLCGGLLIGRLGSEVAQARWRALTDEERRLLRSAERWSRSLHQLGAVAASLLQGALALLASLSAWIAERRQGRPHGKRWVRAEQETGGTTEAGTAVLPPDAAVSAAPASQAPLEVAVEGEGDGGSEADSDAAHQVSFGSGLATPEVIALELTAAGGDAPGAAAEGVAAPQVSEDENRGLQPVDAGWDSAAAEPPAASAAAPEAGVRLVADFGAIDALLDQANAAEAGELALGPGLHEVPEPETGESASSQ